LLIGVSRDKLFLLKPGFSDPAYPDQTFYCWHCALIEGILASFPNLGQELNVVRIDWARPRTEVVELIGADNQSLPVLVLADGGTSPLQTGVHQGRAFVAEKDRILAVLTERHGFPEPHP
jgi:hypothetical protein